ncbi:MAG: ADP-ribosylglycohydrolase family protein [Muribaculaceae bacterium]|nr:ADP-ribosylglycohydrolase family protein [Muribaculaceae bacterium]
MQTNRLKGCLYGYAIGDALGLGTEFMSRPEVAVRYPDGLTTYDRIIQDAHRSQWNRGEYTNDTFLFLLMAESITDRGRCDHLDFCVRLKKWFDETAPMDITTNLRWVLSAPGYEEHPHQTARMVFEQHHSVISRNDSLGRAVMLGIWPNFNEETILDNILLTHSHPITIACSIIIAKMANDLLWHDCETDIETIYALAEKYAKGVVPFIDIARDGTLEELELDDEESFDSSAKALSAALWTLWHHENPADGLYNIISQGGDANSIGALCGALLGLKHGFDALPSHLIEGIRGSVNVENAADRLVPVILAAAK